MECLLHSPAFKCAEMAWVAGVGATQDPQQSGPASTGDVRSVQVTPLASSVTSWYLAP